MALVTGLLAVGLALVHLVAGGVSIAYIFIHVFPELALAQETLRAACASLAVLEHHAYLVALAGLVFYGLERMVKTAQRRQGKAPGSDEGKRLPAWAFSGFT